MLALLNRPSPKLSQGQRTFVSALDVDYELALRQHARYGDRLRSLGADVRTLELNQEHPDGVFLEDVAVVLDEVAVLASMGTATRAGEPAGVESELRRLREVLRVSPPATIEGGDVLRVGRRLLVGLSRRTNRAGVEALAEAAAPFGYSVQAVPVTGCLHLKTAVTALPDDRLLVNPNWIDTAALRDFEQVLVPSHEPWSANTLPWNDRVLARAGHPATVELLESLGFRVEEVDISEFAKAEGGVTCLSILLRG